MMEYYGGNMMSGGFGIVMMVFYALLIALVVVLIVLGVRKVFGQDQKSSSQSSIDRPLEEARMRYAKGEITKEEYEEISKTLLR